ncbi:hypothetical protein P175DRAFT_0556093 [Aspergillus ochraceoroseus IBT 24754]|uniref:HNH nuclease domain-containing protein n=1 Tax=Aspergillus ochraceoroseus IBT 24754 TaxID=1392256 RepID=A0A2T5M4J1_9EURO|nr:uncharacterized protein P175DRAFT_0556093 [Aspergillus ochraceoroseus IBT 24754]PTU23451.1 hypothetical protein P175DRAFT_0556093 [Aspergillus ochraceoroseus IBT 24754]
MSPNPFMEKKNGGYKQVCQVLKGGLDLNFIVLVDLMPVSSRQRISTLRQSCLVRDHYRCVISRNFDWREAERRFEQDGEDCKDDDGNLLRDESNNRFQFLEVAHILPHSLTAVSSGETDL